MSEWKWCLRCGHIYSIHAPTPERTYGPCTKDYCECEGFEQEVANFL
jgi:hypothetical protein